MRNLSKLLQVGRESGGSGSYAAVASSTPPSILTLPARSPPLRTYLRHICRRCSSRFCAVVTVILLLVVYGIGIGGTKYNSLRLTFLDMELLSLKTVTIINETTITSNKGCFWYSDNLFHLMCAVLTDRPVQFHAIANRVPRMQKELFQHLHVKRCESAKEKPSGSKGSGCEDLERNLDRVNENLKMIEAACDAEMSQNTATNLYVKRSTIQSVTSKRKCLHLARNFNRRLQNCSVPLEACDTIVFDDTLPFCPLWKYMQDYSTIISPHGFQLTLPILAHAALDATQQRTKPGPLQIIEVRWPGYQERSYQGMVSIFPDTMNHTLIYGHSPGGRLNDQASDCPNVKACRKAERQKDLYCSAAAQEQMTRAINMVGGG
ncbi:hypothetical protein ACHAWF_003699 [Thalassiosira exigua]